MCYYLLLLFAATIVAWNPDAGLTPEYTHLTDTTYNVSSNPSGISSIFDGNSNTFWQVIKNTQNFSKMKSDACLPYGWFLRSDANVFKGFCTTTTCTATGGGDVTVATDFSVDTSIGVTVANGVAAFTFLEVNQIVQKFGLKGSYGAATTVLLNYTDGTTQVAGTLSTTDNFATRSFLVSALKQVKSIVIASTAAFSLFEFGIMNEQCFESLTVDFSTVKPVGWINHKHYTSNAQNFTIYTSQDGNTWSLMGFSNPNVVATVSTISKNVDARYVKFKMVLPETPSGTSFEYNKASIFEVTIWDQDGPYGVTYPLSRANPKTMTDLIGVNGIWGWGTNAYSDATINTTGPRLYSPVAKHARNYHDMGWDITNPNQIPDYVKMAAGGGTAAQPWLNWDTEYQAWKAGGMLSVDASIQFVSSDAAFAENQWNNVTGTGYEYGYAFAKHFGTAGLIDIAEVGNEPCMSQGFKAGNSSIRVSTCALQADTQENADVLGNEYAGKYFGARVPESAAGNIDILNVHAYSWTIDPSGNRVGVHPEYQASTIHAVRNVLRWRDANMPGKEVHWTEFGWDGGDVCTFSECVPVEAQGIYGVRAALIGARLGLDRIVWFFYGDLNINGFFGVSGLTSYTHQKKPAWYAFYNLMQVLGDCNFVGGLKEDEEAYVYSFHCPSTNKTYLAAWRPVAISDTSVTTLQVTVSGSVPGVVYALDGNVTGPTIVSSNPVTQNGDQWTIKLTNVPYVMEVPAGSLSSTTGGSTSGGNTGSTGETSGAGIVSVSVIVIVSFVTFLL